VLRRIIGEEGEDYPVKALIGIIADADVSDEDIDAFIDNYEDVTGFSDEDEDEETTTQEPSPTDETAKPISKMRATIAKTVVSSWDIPQFPVTMAIDMSNAEVLRAKLKSADKTLSMNDVVIRACTKAIEKYPMINARLGDNQYLLNPNINISIAVAVDEDLMMPVIHACETLGLEDVAEKSRQLVALVKDGALGEAELSGGNFAISNLGMLGVEHFAALVPPGMAAILAVGSIQQEVVVRNSEMVVKAMMRVTLMSDHRIVDGMYAAQFLVELKRLLENPDEL
jgi:pyruvate dehydrogenase E2 component (dihydrolipoamide acetyltransferase)